MPSRYKNEPLITLAEASVKFGYTSDHLAYLCRGGFLCAERHGRLWLTCEKAVADYKTRLEKHGRPGRTEKHINSVLLNNPVNFVKYIIRLYKSIFNRKRVSYRPMFLRTSRAGFCIGRAPVSLPQASLPKDLCLAPWYAERLVILPVFIIMAFGLFAAAPENFKNAMEVSDNVKEDLFSSIFIQTSHRLEMVEGTVPQASHEFDFPSHITEAFEGGGENFSAVISKEFLSSDGFSLAGRSNIERYSDSMETDREGCQADIADSSNLENRGS